MKFLIFLILTALVSTVESQPIGKYCGSNTIISDLEIDIVSKNDLDCSVNIFGTDYKCQNVHYLYSNDNFNSRSSSYQR